MLSNRVQNDIWEKEDEIELGKNNDMVVRRTDTANHAVNVSV